MVENLPYRFSENFNGDWNLFKEVFSNPKTIIFYDGDGILFDTPKVILNKFTNDTGVYANPAEVDRWSYLTHLATNAGLPPEQINHIEDDWYKGDVLVKAGRYLYMKPVVHETVKKFGPGGNFVLTAREPFLADSTRQSMLKWYPEIPQNNLLIRSDGARAVHSAVFKAEEIKIRASKAPWVVLIDDTDKNITAALDMGIKNLLVVNIPMGKSYLDFKHDQLVIIKRFPHAIQAMYPLLDAIRRVAHS